MTTFDYLMERLDQAQPDQWEYEYSRIPVNVSRDQAYEIVMSDRLYAEWFGFRFDAGPPGIPLPQHEDALDNILAGPGCNALDAFCLHFNAPISLPNDVEPEDYIYLLVNSTMGALSNGCTWFAGWLAYRAALASLILGQPEHTWRMMDLFTSEEGARNPHLERLSILDPIRNHPLAHHPLIQIVFWRIWPGLDVSLIPTLPCPILNDDDPQQTIDELEAINAHELAQYVENFVRNETEQSAARHDDHPIVQQLRQCVLEGCLNPPQIETLPEWFLDWARSTGQAQQWELMRLVGLLLFEHQAAGIDMIFVMIAPTSRSQDLEIMRHFEPARALIDELKAACDELPTHVADALLASCWRNHQHAIDAFGIVAEHMAMLETLDLPEEGIILHTLRGMQRYIADMEKQTTTATTIIDAIYRASQQLPTHLTEASLHAITSSLEPIVFNHELIDALLKIDVDDTQALILAIYIRTQIANTDLERSWSPLLAQYASDAIRNGRFLQLSAMRLRLLDDAIDAASTDQAQLYYQRAHTRQLLNSGDEQQVELALVDLQMARGLAMQEGNSSIFARTIASLTRIHVALAAQFGATEPYRLGNLHQDIQDALSLPLEPYDRAPLLQALAYMMRLQNHPEVLKVFDAAVDQAHLFAEGSLWVEITVEKFDLMIHMALYDEVISECEMMIETIPNHIDSTNQAMLLLTYACALMNRERIEESQQQTQAALELIRGQDPQLEAHCRLQLGHIGVISNNLAMASRQLRILQDNQRTLHATMRMDILLLDITILGAQGHFATQRQRYLEARASSPNESEQTRFDLHVALLDIRLGHTLEVPDTLILRGIRHVSRASEEVLIELLFNHSITYQPSTLREALIWARDTDHINIIARLEQQLGEDGAQTLRVALDGELTNLQRMNCAYELLLMTDNQQERLHLYSELERLLAIIPSAQIRIDLASMMQLHANRDRLTLERARTQVNTALVDPLPPHLCAQAQRVLGAITQDSIIAEAPRSAPDIAVHTQWLTEELLLSGDEQADLKYAIAHNLVIMGPLSHPDVVEVASNIISTIEHNQRNAMEQRISWIEGYIRGQTPSRPTQTRLEQDDWPDELILLIQGHQTHLTPLIYEQIRSRLPIIVQTRPDAADRLLGAIIDIHKRLHEDSLTIVHEMIHLVSDIYLHTWSEVLHALERAESTDPMLRNIQNIAQFMTSRHDDTSPIPAPQPINNVQENVQDAHDLAQQLMDLVRRDPTGPKSRDHINQARTLLQNICQLFPEQFMSMVLYANSLKLGPDPQLELALEIYEQAHTISAYEPLTNQATLWKVHADALFMRGQPDDIRRASELVEHSCQVRRGLFLAEALLSWSRIMQQHPDLNSAERSYQAARLMMECVETWPDFAQQPGVQGYIHHCMNNAEPDHPEQVNQWRETLNDVYPSFCNTGVIPQESLALMIPALEHPEFMQYSQVRFRLMSQEEAPVDQIVWPMGPAQMARSQAYLQEQSLIGRPTQVFELLQELEQQEDKGAGLLAACALLRVHLVRIGASDEVDNALNALVDAERAINHVENTAARCFLTHELAMLWSPTDDSDDPINNFSHAVDLFLQCVDLSGGEAHTSVDILGSLARAYRYNRQGDLHDNLRQARRLYRLCLERDLTTDIQANLFMNLSELESHVGSGDRLERIRHAISILEEALTLNPSYTIRNEILANLAWDKTQLALWSPTEQRLELLEEAQQSFTQIDMSSLDSSKRHNARGNQIVSQTALVRIRQGRRAEVAMWRSYMEELQSENLPYRLATVQHNLANALFFGEDVNYQDLFEGWSLTTQALRMRTQQTNPRHHWETTFNIARALIIALASTPYGLPGMARHEVIRQARHYLQEATTSARILGQGEELVETAFMRCHCALLTPNMLAHDAELAWQSIQDSAAYMLLNPASREREAWMALYIAGTLAAHMSEQADEFILSGEDAQQVTRWLIRAQLPTTRLSRARLARPEQASMNVWSTWQQALSSGNQPTILTALQKLREQTPNFLIEETINETTWRWLEGMPSNSVALSLFLNTRTSLALVLRIDDGHRHVDVLGLNLSEIPKKQDNRIAHHAQLVSWLQREFVGPLEDFLPNRPPAILWNPGPGLRLIAPSAIWPNCEVAVTTSFVLPMLNAKPNRRNSTLLALADPGPTTPNLDLRGRGIPTLNALAEISSNNGEVKTMASVGEKFGHELLGNQQHVMDVPSSVQCLLNEASEHSLIVLIAHGEIRNIEDAALICVNECGDIERLDVPALMQAPKNFAGADVILLSCDGGQVGDHLANPSGLAGTLILAGANSVTAPLWPVRLKHAQAVGQAIIEGRIRGHAPWRALLNVHTQYSSSPVLLGGPPPSVAQREEASTHDQMAFVCWVG